MSTGTKLSTYDYRSLLSLSSTSPPQILFRVTDPSSTSPLFWTGRASSSGFACPNLNLAYLEPEVFAELERERKWEQWQDQYQRHGSVMPWQVHHAPSPGNLGPYVRHTILDHVMGKEKQTALPTITSIDERPDTPDDEKTPWISTSTNLFWCIYEICRRLVYLGQPAVYLTIIRPPASGSEDQGREAQGQTRTRTQVVEPARVLRIGHAQAKDMMLSVTMKDNYDTAAKASSNSGERLVWGRVFGQDILCHKEFTMDHAPLDLPPQVFDEGDGRKSSASKWTDRLVWDPTVDAYNTAYRRVMARRREIARAKGEPEASRAQLP